MEGRVEGRVDWDGVGGVQVGVWEIRLCEGGIADGSVSGGGLYRRGQRCGSLHTTAREARQHTGLVMVWRQSGTRAARLR